MIAGGELGHVVIGLGLLFVLDDELSPLVRSRVFTHREIAAVISVFQQGRGKVTEVMPYER
jgi:hypothetical protein